MEKDHRYRSNSDGHNRGALISDTSGRFKYYWKHEMKSRIWISARSYSREQEGECNDKY